jgi:hypothetical protein
VLEDVLRELIEFAKVRLTVAEDATKQAHLANGILAGEELLEFLKAQGTVLRRHAGYIQEHFEKGGLFGGDNGRADDITGSWSQD